MRLLPWMGPDGKRCYLSTDDRGGYLSRLADDMEEVQLDTGEELLEHAAELLSGRPAEATVDELRFSVHRLCEALRDALRIAESRSGRVR